jgi:hypothetical protein
MWALAALALIGVGAARAAEWLFVLCLLAAGVAFCLAVAGGRLVRGLVLSVLIVPIAVLRSLPWVARAAAVSRGGGAGSALRTAATVTVAVALLALFGSLFAAADAAFAAVLDDVLPTVDAGVIFRWIFTFILVGLGVLGASYLALAPPAFDGERAGKTGPTPATKRRSLRRIEWALPVGGLVGLFITFVAIQATVLFGGGDYVLRTAGLTYAEYARGGFWQLLAISVLTLVVIAIAAWAAPRASVADRNWLRALLGALAVLSLVVVFSAMSRMWAYEQAYGFTRLRLLVSVCEIWLGSIFVFVIVAAARVHQRATWLPRLVVAAAVVALVGIGVLNPDRFIAERNIARFDSIQVIDLDYVSSLSADAVPALDRLPEPWRSCALPDIARRLNQTKAEEEWRRWNLARAQARRILADHPVTSETRASTCRSLSTSGRSGG